MLKDPSTGHGHEIQVDTTGHSVVGVQPIRISPFQGGAWALPGFSPEIPSIIRAADLAGSQQGVAAFGLCAHDNGVKLPRGEFTNLSRMITQQWQRHIKQSIACFKVHIPLDVSLVADETMLTATVSGSLDLEQFVLRPVVDRLNEISDGLGWWAANVAMSAGGDGIPLYNLQDIADHACHAVGRCEEFTDEAFLATIRENEGDDQLTREYVVENYHYTWPSELIEEAGGHTWLFKTQKQDEAGEWRLAHKPPRMPTTRVVRTWLRKRRDLPADVRALVQDFIALDEECKRIDTALKHGMPCFDEDDPMAEPGDVIGAIGFITWDQEHDKAWEILTDWGEQAMNSGESTCDTARFQVPIDDASAHVGLVSYLKDLVTRVGAIARAFRHLKV